MIEAGSDTFTLEFHPRLTVIAGVGRLEREGLVNELVSALGPGRAGVHLELRTDAGVRYAVFRPAGGRHCVVDVDAEQDVTTAVAGAGGKVDLLGRAGLDAAAARRAMRVTESDLASRSTVEQYVLRLAHLDQGRLWDVARKVTERQELLDRAAEAQGSTAEEAELCEEIERRHAEFADAEAAMERMRHAWFLLAAFAGLLIAPAAMLWGPLLAVPLVLGAAATATASAMQWRRMERARREEDLALAQVGANSYLGFQISRVNGMVADDQQRRELMQAAASLRAAQVEWELLAEDVPLEWALEHREEIRAAARTLRVTLGGPRNPMALRLSEREETTADIGHSLLDRVEHARTLGAGETLPVFLDDPFASLDPDVKPDLLALLDNASRLRQLVYLTEDPDVVSWARAEALTGNLSIIEPDQHAGDGSRRRSRHVVA